MTTPSPDDDETNTLILARPHPASEPSVRPGGRSGLWKSAKVGARFEGSLLTRAIRERTCADRERSNLVVGFRDKDGKLCWQRCRSGG